MKKILLSFLIVFTYSFCEDYSWQKGLNWQADLEEAKQLAQYHDKLVFIFLESRTCFYCPKLKKEVFNKASFQEKIKKHFIPVILDNSLDYDSDVENIGQAPERLTVSMTPAIYFMGNKEQKLSRNGKKHMIIYGMWSLEQMLDWMDDSLRKYKNLKNKGKIK